MFELNLDLELIPAAYMTRKKRKNGMTGTFTKLILAAKKEPDQFGNTHSIFVSKTKEQREKNPETIYIGDARPVGAGAPVKEEDLPWKKLAVEETPAPAPERAKAPAPAPTDDIPF